MLGFCNSAGGEVGVCLIKNKTPQSLPTHPGFRVPLPQLILSERCGPDQGELHAKHLLSSVFPGSWVGLVALDLFVFF